MIERVSDVTITGRIEAIIDFVSQLCREYQLPHGKGLNIRYMEYEKDKIEVSVEVANWPRPNEILFFLFNNQEKDRWEAYGKPYAKISFHKNVKISSIPGNLAARKNIEVACNEKGEYQFDLSLKGTSIN